MARKSRSRRFDLNSGLLMVLFVSLVSSILTFRKFRSFKFEVESTMKQNLDTLKTQYESSISEFRALVNSSLAVRPSAGSSSNDVASAFGPSSDSRFSSRSENVTYTPLPDGLSIIRVGDWYLSDGVVRYGLGDVSPVGLITNISPALVYTDLSIFSCIRKRSEHQWTAQRKP